MTANSMKEPMIGPRTEAADILHGMKYRGEREDFREAMNRVAFGLKDSDQHYHELREILLHQRFCPAGRIQAAIGSQRHVTPYNCYVSGSIADSFVDGNDSIMARATDAAATMRQGGGIGYDFSTLRPRGELIRKLQAHATGPVSFMAIYDAVCLATSSSGHRRGAQMGVLRCDHPDIEEFIHAKQNGSRLTGFNISVGITDEFMGAIAGNKTFDLQWGGKVYRTVGAVELWEQIMRSTWDWAEPGVLFLDTINHMNNLYYCEKIAATNPCFTGDTLVWTSNGPRNFADLAERRERVKVLTQGDKTDVLSFQWMENPRLTQEKAEIVEVTFALPGRPGVLRCTPEHEFFRPHTIPDHESRSKRPIHTPGLRVRASDLKPGDEIVHASHLAGLSILTKTVKVVSVIPLAEREDVYCGTVPATGRFFVQFPGRLDGALAANCGEQPLPPFGACLLGSFNLVKYLGPSFGTPTKYDFNWELLKHDIPIVVRAMDNVIDKARYPLAEQRAEAMAKRRMGLGVMGLANTLEAGGAPYGSNEFLSTEGLLLEFIKNQVYQASSHLAKEKGVFPLFDAERYLRGSFIQQLSEETLDLISRYGVRNSHLTSIAPTGTIAMAADNVSSGLEPVFSYGMERPINTPQGPVLMKVEDYGVKFLGVPGKRAADVTADEHVEVLITAQRQVDSAVSKTCNVDGKNMKWDDFKSIYRKAWEGGAKGCTTFNASGQRGALLVAGEEADGAVCRIDAETGRRECE